MRESGFKPVHEARHEREDGHVLSVVIPNPPGRPPAVSIQVRTLLGHVRGSILIRDDELDMVADAIARAKSRRSAA